MKSDGIGGRKTQFERTRGTDKLVERKPSTEQVEQAKVDAHHGAPDGTVGAQAEGLGLDALRRLGMKERDGAEGGAGAHQIAQNLAVLDNNADPKLRAGITGMLVALMLTFSHVAPSHAQDTSQITAPHNATLFLPHKTGPPPFTTTATYDQLPSLGVDERSTVFGAQLQALKKQEANNVDAAVQRALDTFTTAMAHALRLDAHGLALGGPLDPARGLTDVEQRAVQKALSNLLSEMPVGALAPEMTNHLGGLLRERGISTVGLEAKRLKDLGGPGGDLVKAMVADLRAEKPEVFYGMAVGLAGAVGAVAYTQGTDALAALGLKPELKAKFFNDRLITKVRAEWGPQFSDPKLTARVEHRSNVTLGGTPFTTTIGAGVVMQGATFKQLEATSFELSGTMVGTYSSGAQLGLSGYAIGDPQKGLERVTLSGAYLNDPWTAGATVSYFAREERTVGQLSVGYKPQKNVEWALVGTMDSKGEKYVGVGVRVGF